jgi:hypothetical protein
MARTNHGDTTQSAQKAWNQFADTRSQTLIRTGPRRRNLSSESNPQNQIPDHSNESNRRPENS